jgi:hypothetical protein
MKNKIAIISLRQLLYCLVICRFEEFGTAGITNKIKSILISIFRSKYSSGELSPKIN